MADLEQQKLAELTREIQLNDLRRMMSLKEGRRFIWRFLSDAGIFSRCFDGTSKTYYFEGRREFALQYFNDIIEACPKEYLLMARENQKLKITPTQEPDNG